MVGHGGSVTTNVAVHVVCPVVTQLLGQSTAATDAVTVDVTVYVPHGIPLVATSTAAPLPVTATDWPFGPFTSHRYSYETFPSTYPGVLGFAASVIRSPRFTVPGVGVTTHV